jgi:hypothetical protein
VHAIGSVVFMQKNMDIKDGFTTSLKEHLHSLVCVHELDEITSNGGKDRSATKEHPRGLKHKRPNFMHGEPPSWTWGWHRQNHANGRDKVHNHLRTHGSEGATEPAQSGGRFGPLSLHMKDHQPKVLEAPPFAGREPFAPRGHPQVREEGDLRRRIAHLEGSTHKWRRRKTPSEASRWSMVPCLASWWGILLICLWVVIDLEM